MIALTAGARMVAAWGGTSMARGAEARWKRSRRSCPRAAGAGRTAQPSRVGRHPARITPSARRSTRSRLRRTTASRANRVHRRGRPASDRVVRPLGLWFWGKVWTLVAWCELRGISGCSGSTGSATSRFWTPTRRTRSGPCGLLPERGRPETLELGARNRSAACQALGGRSKSSCQASMQASASSMSTTTASGLGRRARASASWHDLPRQDDAGVLAALAQRDHQTFQRVDRVIARTAQPDDGRGRRAPDGRRSRRVPVPEAVPRPSRCGETGRPPSSRRAYALRPARRRTPPRCR
jgi:hypothetical protein